MLIKLQLYDLNIQYKPGSQLFIADCLSRSYIKEINNSDESISQEIEAQVNLVENLIHISDKKFKEMQIETQNDNTLKELLKLVKFGWPEKQKLNNELQKYWNYRDEIVSINDVIFKGNKIVVPTKLRPEMLQLIHYNHLGITKCQLRARKCMFWPNINSEIETYIKNCDTCLNFRNSQPKEPLIQTEIPNKPWEVVGTDLFQFKGKTYLILIDYFSKFIEIGIVEKLDSIHTITLLKSFFARHGIPKIIRSDNGTNYSSDEFKEFVNSWNIKHVTSSPTHSQSNGMVERGIQTFKNMMRKAEYDNKDLYLCTLEYRTTPIDSNIPSPASLLFNREINSLLPNFNIFKKEEGKLAETKVALKEKQIKQKSNYDRTTKALAEFQENDKVRVQQKDKTWQSGQVLKKLKQKPRTYMVKQDNGAVVERNRRYLIKDTENKKTKFS